MHGSREKCRWSVKVRDDVEGCVVGNGKGLIGRGMLLGS